MTSHSDTGISGAKWRRKWTRVPTARRLPAAASLEDLFERPHRETLLLAILLLSLLAHAATTPFLLSRQGVSTDAMVAGENAYLQKVMQKDYQKENQKENR